MKALQICNIQKNSKKRLQRNWQEILCLLFLVCVCTLGFQGCKKSPPEKNAQEDVKQIKLLTVVDMSELSGMQEFPGMTKAIQEVDLAFRVPGTLKEFSIIEGQDIKKGDLLAKLDPRDFEIAVKQASASLQGAQAQLKAMKAGARPEQMAQLEANVQACEAQLGEVETRYKRFKQLYEEKVVSKQQLDAVQAEHHVAVSQLEAARQQLAEGQKGARDEDIEAQESQIRMLETQRRNAQNQLSDTELRAPFDGTIARIYVENFEEIMPKQTIVTIQDLSQIEILVDVPESDVAEIGGTGLLFQEVIESFTELAAIFPTYSDRQFPIQFKSYETEADAATQTFRVSGVMDQPEDVTINPGMNVTVRVTFSGVPAEMAGIEETGILIPANAVFADASGTSQVWIVSPDTQQVMRRKIQVGEIYNTRIYVLDGLQDGDVVAISAIHSLREGMKVTQMSNLEDL